MQYGAELALMLPQTAAPGPAAPGPIDLRLIALRSRNVFDHYVEVACLKTHACWQCFWHNGAGIEPLAALALQNVLEALLERQQ